MNTVADGISRRLDFMRELAMTLAAIVTRKQVRQRLEQGLVSFRNEATERYCDVPFTTNLLHLLSNSKMPKMGKIRHLERYSRQNSQILYRSPSDEQPRLVLPNIPEIIEGLPYEFHGSKCFGHLGLERTLCLIEKDYYWRYMERTVRTLPTNQEQKYQTARIIAISSHSYCKVDLALDFIVALPLPKAGFDAIMVVIDRLTKRAHFIPTRTTATALSTAELYRDRCFVLHAIPEEILSDRDSKFTSELWTNLCKMLGTRKMLTTAFRQQASGVTESVNQTIENYLRAFSNINSDDWDEIVSLAGFAYNSRYQASIGMSPFQAVIGYMPSTPATINRIVDTDDMTDSAATTLGQEIVEKQKDLLARVKRQLQAAQDQMSAIYDNKRPIQYFSIGDLILLSASNLETFHAGTTKKKLRPRWIRPYKILERVGHDYYRLEVPSCVRFHPVFRTSLLKAYVDHTVTKIFLRFGYPTDPKEN
ncbi:Gag-pol [Phytophthora megakarya]|uniref:Gag-pol n=1 Tax=Phytophthora megakarya TaxID=4795 RepID=A0A225WB97_9STRA|nr:Gag-pol [Phytophthora megakarya]